MVFINLRNDLQRPKQFVKVVTVLHSDFFQQYIVYHNWILSIYYRYTESSSYKILMLLMSIVFHR